MAKADVKREPAPDWNRYAIQPCEEALPLIYRDAIALSHKIRQWYWDSIQAKRRGSFGARVGLYLLVVVGVSAPLGAAILGDAQNKLAFTQVGVVALALAGLVQLADRVFGWSSGWLRYMTTVTAMEKLTAQFELDWAAYLLARSGKVHAADVGPMFELAKRLHTELEKRQSEETDAWVAEFNAGMAALNEMIKLQKDATEKAKEAARSALETREQQARTGALQLTILQATSRGKPFAVYVDGEKKHTLLGNSWSEIGLEPGQHKVRVMVEDGSHLPPESSVIANVLPGETAALEIKLS